MGLPKIKDFVMWALTHALQSSVPYGSELAIPLNAVGSDPWHYLFGSVRVKTTPAILEYYWNKVYRHKMTRSHFDLITSSWMATDYATDCQGLLDAYMTYELGITTDINANANYKNWCTDKGKIVSIDRPWVIGEALFKGTDEEKTHVGWICGFDRDGEPLAVEAMGFDYGVVVTRVCDRPWAYRGLMTKKFDYKEEPEVGWLNNTEAVKAMQMAMKVNGITDYEGKELSVDGKWGKRSQSAFDKMCKEHGPQPETDQVDIYINGQLDDSFRIIKEG